MSTSYSIQVGYNSVHDKSDVGAKLIAVVDAIQRTPGRIVAEVLRLHPELSGARMMDFAAMYKPPVEDLTLRIETDADEHPIICQTASGGGESRDFKEITRRAFARLVIEDMHRAGMDVSFNTV